MYKPYMRGRQSELLAIRLLLEGNSLSDKITPMIEPIKPTATLRKTLETFIDKNHKLFIISNPQVGNFHKELNESPEEEERFNELIDDDNIQKIRIVTKKNDFNVDSDGYILSNTDHINWFNESNVKGLSKLLFVPDETEFRRKLHDENKRVLHVDHFKPEIRNADYLPLSSRPFSSDHKYYAKEGYHGFSDYSIVGSSFMEGGFAPRAVAIHMIYFNDDKDLRIRHFTSDTNDDITNPAGKFREALIKLIDYFDGNDKNETIALQKFREIYDNGHYPGLGSVKQLSIMHHLELIGKFLGHDI